MTTIKNGLINDPFYPRCKINGSNPYDEKIMSMPSVITQSDINTSLTINNNNNNQLIKGNYFFFIFNFDNYYHFLYDTLPYLYFYFAASCSNINLKLLIAKDHKFLPFQIEMLKILGLNEENFVCAEDNTLYENIIIPTSLTHGHDSSNASCSNSGPEEEAIYIWNLLKRNTSITKSINDMKKKIYISRRTHLHQNTENIGTNYTTRRRCINEDEVVDLLLHHGYEEIFTENLTTQEKIKLFNNASHVIGFIGGGLANLLFSNSNAIVGCIETPEFLKINQRFVHSMNHTKITYLPITKHAPFEGPWPLYTRVRIKEQIGEITEWLGSQYSINVATKPIAGFSLTDTFREVIADPEELEPIDGGLNSPFICDINGLRTYLESITE